MQNRQPITFKQLTILFFAFIFALPTEAQDHSVAREWNERCLEAIRRDFARPTVHARNLFHVSIALYDAWAVYEDEARPYLLGNTIGDYTCQLGPVPAVADKKLAQEEAMSYAAYRLLKWRFRNSPNAGFTLFRFDQFFQQLGYDLNYTSMDYVDGPPAALGNYIAQCIIDYGLQDGANEAGSYENQFYEPVNEAISIDLPGNETLVDFNHWQPITLDVFIDQSGNVTPLNTPDFLGPEWGAVTPFALKDEDLTVYNRDNFDYQVYHDPGPPPYIDINNGGQMSDLYKWGFEMVAIWASHLDPADNTLIDISPGSIGNIPSYPTDFNDYDQFYDFFEGGDPSLGHSINPATGEPYAQQLVKRADYARVLAEFWADGPDSETPPGHWFTLLNYVNDHPEFEKRFEGEGEILDDLEWDVKAYLMMGGAMHDVAITAWGIKGWYDYIRPVSAIRGMAELGQSSDPQLPNYHPGGYRLYPGYIELVEAGDPLAGNGNQNVGKVKLYTWKGPDFINDPDSDVAGVDWILAENWWPYQRPSFVTPPFAGYVSGHSTYSRAAADLLERLTGDPFFPGGIGEFRATRNEFLVFEDGPSTDVVLQWATYRDASDQTSLSRIWGGIHPPADDIPGREIGMEIAVDVFEKARTYFFKDEDNDGFYSFEDCDDTNENVNPDAVETVYNGIDDDCDPSTLDDDLDQDGFNLADDCDDTNFMISPSVAETVYNGIDDDCDPSTLDDDLDQDGFDLVDDCDDNNDQINPAVAEIVYNGIDDDCDPTTLDDDLDEDGFDLVDDCDDNNDQINPAVAEIVYNGIDDDCDPTTLDDDLDEDGFVLADDCDDNNNQINPAVAEIVYNGIDDDCDPLTLDDDLDEDGFVLADECDDTNSSIYPGATEIADNDIDEDCNGVDLYLETKIFPNPLSGDVLFIRLDYSGDIDLSIIDFSGRLLRATNVAFNFNETSIDLSDMEEGMYIVRLSDEEGNELLTQKIMKL